VHRQPFALTAQRRESLVFFRVGACKKVFTPLTTFLITPRFQAQKTVAGGGLAAKKVARPPPCLDLHQVLSALLLYHA